MKQMPVQTIARLSPECPWQSLWVFRRVWPLQQTMGFNGHELSQREVAYVLAQSQRGFRFAEIAPLPGFSRETLCQSLQAFYRRCQEPSYALPASAAFAWDTLLRPAQLSTPGKDVTLLHLPPELSPGALTQYIQQQSSLFNQSTHVKLKVARHAPTYEALALTELLTLNPNLKVRCDANQGWQEKAFIEFAYALSEAHKARIEYIEEPTNNLTQALAIAAEQGLTIALDEHLQDPNFRPFFHPQLAAFVIKPSLVGSLARCQQLIDYAFEQGWQASISSSFESPLGLELLASLAKELTPNNAAGLDTAKYFKKRPEDAEQPTSTHPADWIAWLKKQPLVWQGQQ